MKPRMHNLGSCRCLRQFGGAHFGVHLRQQGRHLMLRQLPRQKRRPACENETFSREL